MNQISPAIFVFLLFIFAACSLEVVEIKNERMGKMKATMALSSSQEKKFSLDSISAPRPPYMQIYTDSNGSKALTFLNTYASAIYIYDYAGLNLKKVIGFKKEGKDGIKFPLGYYIKNYDSVYVYNKSNNELVLINDTGSVLSRISLINNHPIRELSWTLRYPQYFPTTGAALMGDGQQLIFPGQYFLFMPDSISKKMRFEAHVDLNNNRVSFFRQYPESLYGHNIFWEDEGFFPYVYSDFTPDNRVVYSFPVSHDIYLADKNKEGYSVSYVGSNEAGTITSFSKKLPDKELVLSVCKTDLYCTIKFDPYNKVYYRFLRKAMPGATYSNTFNDKPLSVIILDESFKYLGETTIGTCNNFNWDNAFVTEEGLNIEYVDQNDLSEANLHFKIFKPQPLH